MITLISGIKKMIHELTNKSDTNSQVVRKKMVTKGKIMQRWGEG